MLRDVRGAAKRIINFFWLVPGEVAMEGTAARVYAELMSTEGYDPLAFRSSLVSYDVMSAETPDIFEGGSQILDGSAEDWRWRGAITSAVAAFGLTIDSRSWHWVAGVLCAGVARSGPGVASPRSLTES